MKHISKIALSTLVLLFITSCSNENDSFTEKSIDYSSAFANKIGYENPNSGEFNEINESQLIKYWKATFELNPETKFNNVKLIKAQIEEGEEQYYMLNSTSTNGKINISSKVLLTKSGFRMEGSECKCESTNCSFGCEVIRMCQCSTCSPMTGTCKKTHTVKELTDAISRL